MMALSPCRCSADWQGRELIQHGTPLFPAACYLNDLTVDVVPWHWHEELEAILVEHGRFVLAVEGERYTLEEGTGALVNTGALHSAVGPGDCRLRSLVFHPRLIGSIDSIFWQGYLQPLLSDASRRCIDLDDGVPWGREALEAITLAWESGVSEPYGYEFLVREALSKLILLLAARGPAGEKPPPEKALRDAERMKVMLQYVQERYSETLTVSAIAQSASISVSECLRCFRGVINTTPIQYVRQLRVQKAAALLVSTDWKIADVGAACGFQEMNYFARAFREHMGAAPSEYRRQRRSSGGGALE